MRRVVVVLVKHQASIVLRGPQLLTVDGLMAFMDWDHVCKFRRSPRVNFSTCPHDCAFAF